MVNEQQAMTTQNQEVDEVFNFEDFFHIILSHWKLIAMCVILAIGAASLYILRTTPSYTRGALSHICKQTVSFTQRQRIYHSCAFCQRRKQATW